jgi:universal stress protein E
MWSIHRIMAAVKDPTARSLPAALKATQLACALNAKLELFHAIDSSVHVDPLRIGQGRVLQIEREERAQYLQRLERIAARLRLHTNDVTVAAEWDYPNYEAIIRRAANTGADLIVAECDAGLHFMAGFRRLADWELLRLSPVPVLLVRRPRPYHHPKILAAVDPSRSFDKPAELDANILSLGNMFSKALRGELHAVTSYDSGRPEIVLRADSPGGQVPSISARQVKDEFDDLLESANVLPGHRHLIGGHPDAGVSELARRLRVDIVVAGSVSRAGLQRLLIGNTSEQLLSSLACDLLAVKHSEFSARVSTESRSPKVTTLPPSC